MDAKIKHINGGEVAIRVGLGEECAVWIDHQNRSALVVGVDQEYDDGFGVESGPWLHLYYEQHPVHGAYCTARYSHCVHCGKPTSGMGRGCDCLSRGKC